MTLHYIEKKELLKLIFKRITIEEGKISCEPYEPFKSIKEDYLIKWQLPQEQIVIKKRSQPCISGLSDVPTVLCQQKTDQKERYLFTKRRNKFYVYILQSKQGTYYTGYTKDLENRIAMHSRGNGAKYLKGRGPVELVYAKEYRYYKNALCAERNIKKLTRERKKELIKAYANSPDIFC